MITGNTGEGVRKLAREEKEPESIIKPVTAVGNWSSFTWGVQRYKVEHVSQLIQFRGKETGNYSKA